MRGYRYGEEREEYDRGHDAGGRWYSSCFSPASESDDFRAGYDDGYRERQREEERREEERAAEAYEERRAHERALEAASQEEPCWGYQSEPTEPIPVEAEPENE